MSGMYLRECLIENVGPISALDFSFDVGDDGKPKPAVLVGKNGIGKTIVLAYVVDALAELAKQRFGDVVLDQRIGHMPFFKAQ
jgi:predicted ATP-binding protein involved in virulence